jgi:hypothetical protein
MKYWVVIRVVAGLANSQDGLSCMKLEVSEPTGSMKVIPAK